MLKKILAISGKPGLFKALSQGKNMLIVEALATGKRMPVYSRDKVISLGDISMYTLDEDVPLSKVFTSLKEKAEGAAVDLNGFADDADLRAYFRQVLPDFDEERVYTADIKKLINWYNLLLQAGITEYADVDEAEAEDETEK